MKAPTALCLALILLSRDPARAIGAGRLPGETMTNDKGSALQYNLCNDIYSIERRLAPSCEKSRVIQTEIVDQPVRLTRMMKWTERWTIDRCGVKVTYLIDFYFRGSVGQYKIQPPKSQTASHH